MQNQWAFHWILWLLHNQKSMGVGFALVTGGMLLGNLFLTLSPMLNADLQWLGMSLLVMVVLAAWLLSSVRTALLMGLLSGLVLTMVTGALGWAHSGQFEKVSALSSLAFLVVVSMMMSNFVHLLTGLHREMARGQFQHDALSEALQMNMQPILLSNVTTAISFAVAAWFDPELKTIAWIVGLGALFSLWVSFTWLPWLLLNWFIECRVGEPKDRYGLVVIVEWLQQHATLRRLLAVGGAGLGILALWMVFSQMEMVKSLWVQIGGAFFGLTLLLALVWQSLKYAVLNTFLGLYSVLVVAAVILVWTEKPLAAWMLVVPLGLIIDDGIHFFVRFLRAKRGFFQQNAQAIRFTLVSIGRPIWVTSLLLLAGMSVLALSSNPMIQLESWVVILSILVMTFAVLYWLPAWVISIL